MSELKHLNDEDLGKVIGGSFGLDDPSIPCFSGYINMYSLTEGSEYYFVYQADNRTCWFKGKLLRSWEEDASCNTTIRQHKIEITQTGSFGNSKTVGEIVQLKGDNTAVYTNRG